MKTQSFPPPHHFVDIAPLTARFDILMAAILAFIEAGHIVRALKLSHKMNRVVRLGIKLEKQNVLLKRKFDMLLDKCWRDRVLKELGGMRRLKSWEAAVARNAVPFTKPAHDHDAPPIWLFTPERRAESERLKEHAKKCARACVSAGVFRDKIRMDFEGEFRLPPIPRRIGAVRREMIYTEASICDYFYNAMPYYEMKTFGPAAVWPAEFRMAIAAEADIHASIKADSKSTERERAEDGEIETKPSAIPTRPLRAVLSYKVYTDVFDDPFKLPAETAPPDPPP